MRWAEAAATRKSGARLLAKLGLAPQPPPEPLMPRAVDRQSALNIPGRELKRLRPTSPPNLTFLRDATLAPPHRAKGKHGLEALGFNLHAGVRIEAGDRVGRERLLRYCMRARFPVSPVTRVTIRVPRRTLPTASSLTIGANFHLALHGG